LEFHFTAKSLFSPESFDANRIAHFFIRVRALLNMGKKDTSLNVSSSAVEETSTQDLSHEDKLKFVSVIAKPMATKKLTKKVKMEGKVQTQLTR